MLTVAGLVQLAVVLMVVGLVWWLITTYLPLPQPIRLVVTVVLVIAVILYLLSWAGLLR